MMSAKTLEKLTIPKELGNLKRNRFLPLFLVFNCGLSVVAILLMVFNILLTPRE